MIDLFPAIGLEVEKELELIKLIRWPSPAANKNASFPDGDSIESPHVLKMFALNVRKGRPQVACDIIDRSYADRFFE